MILHNLKALQYKRNCNDEGSNRIQRMLTLAGPTFVKALLALNTLNNIVDQDDQAKDQLRLNYERQLRYSMVKY